MTAGEIQFKSIADCTINEITELWNIGFSESFVDTKITSLQMLDKLGQQCIHPTLSVAAYLENIPAGFVLIGWREIDGRKMAWNGGTGVHPSFRGKGLGRRLLHEAIRGVKQMGAHSLSLETRTRPDNGRAVRAYESNGFVKRDILQMMRLAGDFTSLPFCREQKHSYIYVKGQPEVVRWLPFHTYDQTSWTTQWFSISNGQSLIAYDVTGKAAGFALYKESYNNDGTRNSIHLIQCEADPTCADVSGVIRSLLIEVFRPMEQNVERSTHYIRTSNVEAKQALAEAGFEVSNEEYWMTLPLGDEQQ